MTRTKLSTVFLIVFVDLCGFGIVIPFIPLWADQYQPSASSLALLLASYSTMQFLAAPVLGHLSDRFGRRPVLIGSLCGSIVGYLILAQASSLAWLFAARIVDGISGGNISTAHAVIGDITSDADRTRGMGIIGAAFGLGFILGPAIGGALLAWHPAAPGIGAASLSALALVMVLTLLPETRRPGASAQPRGITALGALRRVAGERPLRRPLLLAWLVTTAFAGFEVTFSLFLQHKFNLSVWSIGLTLALVGTVSAVIQGGLIGGLSRKFGALKLIATGLAAMSLALALLPYPARITTLLPALVLLAFGAALTSPSLAAHTSRLVGSERQGEVMGCYQSLASLGRVVGPLAAGFLYKSVGPSWPVRSAAIVMFLAFLIAWPMSRKVAPGADLH
jgi:MFS family permease